MDKQPTAEEDSLGLEEGEIDMLEVVQERCSSLPVKAASTGHGSGDILAKQEDAASLMEAKTFKSKDLHGTSKARYTKDISTEELGVGAGIVLEQDDKAMDDRLLGKQANELASATTGAPESPHEAEDAYPPPPPALTLQPSSRRAQAVPGAFYGGGSRSGMIRVGGVSFSSLGLPREAEQGGSEIDEELQQETRTAQDLVVANPVQHQEEGAVIASPDQDDRKRAADGRHRKELIILASAILGLLLLGGVILLIVFLVVLPKQEDSNGGVSSPQDIASSQPALTLSDQILGLFPNYTLATIQQDREASSPQTRAFEWLLGDPNLLDYTDARKIQRFSLATFYYSTSPDDNAMGWTDDSGWLDYSTHECQWAFFKIAEWLNTVMRYNMNLQGPCWESDQAEAPGETYRHLMLSTNNLEGTIPEEIFLLTSLKSIVLDSNSLYGTLSSRIGQLSNLDYISVSGTEHLDGTLPSELGRLTNLRYAYFFTNLFTGPIPSEMALLTKLEMLGLFLTSVTGTIPEQFAPPMMKNLYLASNHLTGTLPTRLVSLPRLERFVVSRNQLTGKIPSEIGLVTSCWQFVLNVNAFQGTIPNELGSLVTNGSLLNVNLTANAFSGTVPPGLCLLQTPEYQNRTPPPNVVIPSPAHLEHDCNAQLCGCFCNCSGGQ